MKHSLSDQISLNARLASIVIDHVIMVLLFSVTAAPSIFLVEDLAPFLSQPYDYVALLGLTVYFCKDIFEGRSPGKRILKLQLVCNQNGQIASPTQCVVRNIFCIIWPIELIVSMINPNRRIGDRIAGTRLVKFGAGPYESQISINQIVAVIAATYGLLLIVTILILHC